MKCLITFVLLPVFSMLCAQSPVGIWQTVDDNEGDIRSEMELYMTDDGTLEGKVHHLYRPDAPITCPRCPGDKKDSKLIGLVIIWDLEEEEGTWCGGRILNPENGKSYKCLIELESEDKLKVRGYLGFPALGRSQFWFRKKDEVEAEAEVVPTVRRNAGGGF